MRGPMGRWLGAIAAMLVLAGVAGMPAGADEDDERQFAASILEGTCDTVVSQPVAEVGALERDGESAMALVEAAGADPETAWGAEAFIAPSLDDLRARDHVVAVREARGDASPVVACGPVGGDGDAVEVDLKAFGATGLEGLARIETVTRVERTTRVEVAVWEAPAAATRDGRQMPEAPEVELELFDGETFRLSEQRGKTVVIVLWASWCPYCDKEFPMYEELWQDLRDEGVVFLGVGLKNDDQGEAESFIEEHGATFPVGRDTEGGNRVRGEIESTFGVPATPALFIITPDGHVYGAQFGEIDRDSFEEAIRDAARYREGL